MTNSNLPDQITFEFVRSPQFRVVHSNGAWGGITLNQELSVTFYSERAALPQRVSHHVASDGVVGPEVKREGTFNIQRECEIEVLMSMQNAVNLHRWLGNRIDEWRDSEVNTDSANQVVVS